MKAEDCPKVKMDGKLKSLEELTEIVQALKEQDKKIVHCHGVFDQTHPGHIRHLKAASREGDVLIVTVTPDRFVNKGPGRPVFNEALRAESIAALHCVDFVAINEWPTAVETIKKLKPDVYVKGSDYIHRENDPTGGIYEEEEAIWSIGGRIHFTNELSFSSTELLNGNFSVYPEQAQKFLEEFRSSYSADDVIQQLRELKKMKVMVIGDAIIDEYHYCEVMGKSPKDNIITTRYLGEETFAGGALAAANHIAGFCEHVHLLTCLGTKNNYEGFILEHLKPNIKPKFFYSDDMPTLVKRRFIDPAFLSKIFEIAYIGDGKLPAPLEDEICNYLKERGVSYDLVITTDFGHGLISKETAAVLCQTAKFLAVNAQTNSANAGFNLITKYPRVNYVCLNELELRLACHDRFEDLKNLVRQIGDALDCRQIAITRGYRGSLSYAQGIGFFEIPALSTEIVDRTGASDAYLSITAPCVASGMDMRIVGFVGNAVGALQVRTVGNKQPVEAVPLFKFIKALLG